MSASTHADDIFHSPFGTLPMDTSKEDSISKCGESLHLAAKSAVLLYDNSKYIVKVWHPDTGTPSTIQRDFHLMRLAGECSQGIDAVGRVFRDGQVEAIIFPRERVLEPKKITSIEERMLRIRQLCSLVDKLHEKNIIHGDIKPSNILIKSDDSMIFCDFECACLDDGVPFVPRGFSSLYIPQSRYVMNPPRAITKGDDLYSTGMTIWEIYTGVYPYLDSFDNPYSVDLMALQSVAEDFVIVGARPSLDPIDDPIVAKLITSYLDKAPALPYDIPPKPSRRKCAQTSYAFKFCRVNPPHSYTRIVKCYTCAGGALSPCPQLYVAPVIAASKRSPVCPHCRKDIVYSGI